MRRTSFSVILCFVFAALCAAGGVYLIHIGQPYRGGIAMFAWLLWLFNGVKIQEGLNE